MGDNISIRFAPIISKAGHENFRLESKPLMIRKLQEEGKFVTPHNDAAYLTVGKHSLHCAEMFDYMEDIGLEEVLVNFKVMQS